MRFSDPLHLFLAIPLGIVLLDTAGVEVPGADTWAEVARQTAISLRPTKES